MRHRLRAAAAGLCLLALPLVTTSCIVVRDCGHQCADFTAAFWGSLLALQLWHALSHCH